MSNEEILLNGIFKTGIPEEFTKEENLVVIDAFAQFSQNPTSMSACYGVEKNYPFIGENLKKRYNIGKITVDSILNFLKKSFEKMRATNPDVYFWRDAIADYIKEEYDPTKKEIIPRKYFSGGVSAQTTKVFKETYGIQGTKRTYP